MCAKWRLRSAWASAWRKLGSLGTNWAHSEDSDQTGRHRVLEYYQVWSNDDPGFTLIYFTARSNLVPYTFLWKKVKTMDFSETIVVCDIKIGRCSQLNEYMYMKLYQYQRSRSLIDIGWNLSVSLFLNFFSSVTTRPIEAKFHVEPPWNGGTKVYSNGPGHMTKMPAMTIYSKNHERYFSLESKGWWPWNLI